ncbi:unnamed protein product [Didymodactylos carnosus]|uniref:GAF domain-containing protein n=1 Tax=Didymodactylos carnosus TaxID=1234261 RepID=A0A813SWQ2_9BILA|nr:unnamed protein product [Didymodactylos carnosus]CAF1145973.1 unnamed protein product [Didymodactylos carnosus]CAF3588910.1 unnamed protein product [Didymodactylos carnosus]CAF3947610.1 unnamed protein product [Didymodactylos carnosus]
MSLIKCCTVNPKKKQRKYATDLVTPDAVRYFLNDNPEFLESYILNHVNHNTIEQWICKLNRPSIRNSANNIDTNTASKSNAQRLSITTEKSIIKLSELGDKRRLLNELTDDIHQNVTKAQILYELGKCISQTVAADNFNLYLVDETGASMRVYNAENDEDNAVHFAPVKIGVGHCIAGYVGYTKETVRISNMANLSSKYPDGLYVANGNVTCVMAHPLVNNNGQLLGVVEFYRENSASSFTNEDEEVSA